MYRKTSLLLLAFVFLSRAAWPQFIHQASSELLHRGKNFKLYTSGNENVCQNGFVALAAVFDQDVRIPDEEEYRTLFHNVILPAAKRHCGFVNQVYVFHVFDGYFPPQSPSGEVGSANIKAVPNSNSWTVEVRGFRSVEERKVFHREQKEAEERAGRPTVRYEDLPEKSPELKAALEKYLRTGIEAWDLQASGESYRTAIEIFAKVCGAAYLDGCLRLDRAIAALRANCRGESKDGDRKPWACGAWGYALEKTPDLSFEHYYRNFSGRVNQRLIGDLYQTACKAGETFYCKAPPDPYATLERPKP